MAFRALPSLLDAHDSHFAPSKTSKHRNIELLDAHDSPFGWEGHSQQALSKTTRLCSVGSAGALPPLGCSRPVKLRPAWDRSCTRVISNARVGEASESFSTWSKRASSLRPSVLRSPRAGSSGSNLRAHWQDPRETRQSPEDTDIDSDQIFGAQISTSKKFRQHILKQVKMKLGATSRVTSLMRKPSFKLEAKPQTVDKDESNLGSREQDFECNEQATPVKIHTRPKAPAFPGARRSHLPTATMAQVSDQVSDTRETEHKKKRKEKEDVCDESDGIYEDDGSGCDSDF